MLKLNGATTWLAIPPRRRNLALAAIGFVGIAILLGMNSQAVSADPAPPSQPGCDDGFGCIWQQSDFDGNKAQYPGDPYGGAGWMALPGSWNSAKNRYGSRKFEVGRFVNGSWTAIACMDPNEDRPDPGHFEGFKVGANGSSCNN